VDVRAYTYQQRAGNDVFVVWVPDWRAHFDDRAGIRALTKIAKYRFLPLEYFF
jgi:hypothetical protein